MVIDVIWWRGGWLSGGSHLVCDFIDTPLSSDCAQCVYYGGMAAVEEVALR